MKLKFIGKWIKDGHVSASQGRLIEYAIIGAVTYLLGAVMAGEIINLHAFIVATISPFAGAFLKAKRDLDKEFNYN